MEIPEKHGGGAIFGPVPHPPGFLSAGWRRVQKEVFSRIQSYFRSAFCLLYLVTFVNPFFDDAESAPRLFQTALQAAEPLTCQTD